MPWGDSISQSAPLVGLMPLSSIVKRCKGTNKEYCTRTMVSTIDKTDVAIEAFLHRHVFLILTDRSLFYFAPLLKPWQTGMLAWIHISVELK